MSKTTVVDPMEETPLIDMTAEKPLATVNRSAMSRALGVDLAHISRILSGQRNPSLGVAVRMAEYLGITLDKLNELLKAESTSNS